MLSTEKPTESEEGLSMYLWRKVFRNLERRMEDVNCNTLSFDQGQSFSYVRHVTWLQLSQCDCGCPKVGQGFILVNLFLMLDM